FDVVSLANNHALDYGPEALLDGINLLQTAGILPVGAGENSSAARAPAIIQINGIKLGFLAYANVLPEGNSGYDVAQWEATDEEPGMAWGRPEEIAADVAQAKQQVDHVIVLLHSGIEYLRFITPEQQDQARSAIDAGATLVIGHHAHILQKVEEYHGGLIAYGLGNFAFEIDGEPDTMVLHAWLNQDGVARFELIPAVVRPGGQPRPATAEEGDEILAKIGR
ncbi:MAG: poly-gamma-glutamate capsule biosynthesis protein CapA/YwtB (metallophosphatase superfamily), partial [Candidatus Promineifilaceae bacterium]